MTSTWVVIGNIEKEPAEIISFLPQTPEELSAVLSSSENLGGMIEVSTGSTEKEALMSFYENNGSVSQEFDDYVKTLVRIPPPLIGPNYDDELASALSVKLLNVRSMNGGPSGTLTDQSEVCSNVCPYP